MAQSGLARLTGGQKVAGSNPVAPICFIYLEKNFSSFCVFVLNISQSHFGNNYEFMFLLVSSLDSVFIRLHD